ncbi:MAG: ATP-binding protein [Sediminibacterium sp.]|nr:ATP-binding protein [Sediminibacterium sp.]
MKVKIMYTEVIRIIEGALKNDSSKVLSYANLLVENLRKNGEVKAADRIALILNNKAINPVFRDQLMNAPVDQESRLTMADIIMPGDPLSEVILSEMMKNTIDTFIGLINHRDKLQTVGIDVNASLLLYGPPGCGKTTIAKFVAHELKLPLVIARLDSLISSLLGNTAKNLRKVFDFSSNRPCILLLDEFDAIAKARDDQHELGELKRVINSLLQNIDEFTAAGNILIAATNHQELLDKAIWRRFNYVVEVGKPDKKNVINLISSTMNTFTNNIINDIKRMDMAAESMNGLSFAEIKTVCNNAISKAIIDGKEELVLEDLITQLFLFHHNNKYENESLVKFLESNGLSKPSIAEYLGISYRKAASIIDKK